MKLKERSLKELRELSRGEVSDDILQKVLDSPAQDVFFHTDGIELEVMDFKDFKKKGYELRVYLKYLSYQLNRPMWLLSHFGEFIYFR